MISRTTPQFRKLYRSLPAEIKRRARLAYARFQVDPWHQSLRFKQVHPSQPIYSVRITLGYRALGRRDGDEVIWFWIGSHADYDQLLARR